MANFNPQTDFKPLVRQAGLAEIERVDALRPHASARQIYRLWLKNGQSRIGVYNHDIAENRAFVQFTEAFHKAGLPVAAIDAFNGSTTYIETDFGDETLMQNVLPARELDAWPEHLEALYREALSALVRFQTEGLALIDKSLCYQGHIFSGAAVRDDVVYFHDEYVTRRHPNIHLDDWGDDIRKLVEICSDFAPGYFMFRDFQSRNIMVTDRGLKFIDYQSGREGPLQYDVISLLNQSQAAVPYEVRERLIHHYLDELTAVTKVSREAFLADYQVFALARAMQTLGAYGKFGLGQGKAYFLGAIPFALENLKYILANWPRRLDTPTLKRDLKRISDYDPA